MPRPSAASISSSSRLASAVTALRRIGSSAYSASASHAGRNPSVGRSGPNTVRAASRMGKNSASSARAGMVCTRLAKPSATLATVGDRLAHTASGSATAMPSATAAAHSKMCSANCGPRSRTASSSGLIRPSRQAGGPVRAAPLPAPAPRRRPAPASSAAGVSSATMRPPSITSTREASSRASAMSCVTITVVSSSSRWRPRTRFPSWPRVMGSSAPKGSSISKRCESPARARATPTRWRCPPESSAGRRLAIAGSSSTSSSSFAMRASGRRSPTSRGVRAMFSATLICGNRPMPWKT